MSKSIGILYLCTGDYKLFWEDFYKSFDKFFLPNIKKYYYIFTDDVEYIDKFQNESISVIKIDSLPWPLITLLRFRYFLFIEKDLKKHDYLMFSNANVICEKTVTAEEFLPRREDKEGMSFVVHPGYYMKKTIYNFPYEII